MDEKIEITEFELDGEVRSTTSADLVLHHVNGSWGVEAVVLGIGYDVYKSGDAVSVAVKTSEGEFHGDAKVLRALGSDPMNLELFNVGDLYKGEEVFEIAKFEVR